MIGKNSVTRPVLRYFGGKWNVAPWIIGHFPKHRIYIEPFGGAASVLMRKRPSELEIINDVNSDLYNLFVVLRDPINSQRLIQELEFTPFSEEEFFASYEASATDSALEKARKLIVRSWLGHGSTGLIKKTGVRGNIGLNPTVERIRNAAVEWNGWKSQLQTICNRLRNIVIWNRCAFKIFQKVDRKDTLFYVDPPYLPSTRSDGCYENDFDAINHEVLLSVLMRMKSMVVLSGYDNALYDSLEWKKHSKKAYSINGLEREECIWINPAAEKNL